ncbi:MAG: hypothetical protein ACFFEY_07150 [Candidatus Thorarchaeota archaeon]
MTVKGMKIKIYRLLFYLKGRINAIMFVLSLVSILIVFFNLIGLSSLILEPFFYLSTIFIILFLPSYPIFFNLFKGKRFNNLERLSLTVVGNLVFFILIGYLGYLLNIPITGFYFYIVLLIFFLSFFGFTFYFQIRKTSINFLKSKKELKDVKDLSEDFSILRYIQDKVPLNVILLIIFIILICILNIVRVQFFPGTDPWLHIFNSKIITKYNYLPLLNYHGTMGLHIFESVISFFSGINHIFVPRFFIFYTFFLSSLIFYNICIRIFKSKNLALFGVFLLEFSSLGFSTMMIQYWPSGLSLIMLLMAFLLLYIRLKRLINLSEAQTENNFSNLLFNYILIGIIFISAFLTHDLTSFLFLVSFLWLYLIYFLKDRRKGIDFLFLCALSGLFLILNYIGIDSGFFGFFNLSNIPWYFLLFIGVAGIISAAIIFWKLVKSIDFKKGKYTSTIMGKDKSFYKKFEDKVIIPLFLSIIVIFTIILLIINIIWLNFEPINILNISEILLISIFSFWGLLLFQKKPKGKILYIWGLGLIIFLLVGFLLNIFIIRIIIWDRFLYLLPPIIVIGFIAYIYKLIKLNSIQSLRMKIFTLSIIIFSLFTTYFYELRSFDIFNLKKREVSVIQWYTNNTYNTSVILTEFGWGYVFNYYDYPFYDINEALVYNENIYIYPAQIDLFPPSNHINESGINILQEIKVDYSSDVYILFEADYIIGSGFNLFGQLTSEEIENYYSFEYLNKICSSKTENGNEIPLFWVI